jgi:hypothetical protein
MEHSHTVPREPAMRNLIRAALILTALVVAGLAVFLTAAYRATQQVPEFYQAALTKRPVEQKAAADALEREVLQLHNEVRQPGRWVARFSQDQINGWLAADLPVKFPGVLPRGVSEPRVAIGANQLQMAVRFKQGEVETVLSLAGDAYLTERPNEVAIHIDHVRAGAFPVPLSRFLDNIAEQAGDAGMPIRWDEQDGDPVAMVTLPLDREEFKGKQLRVEELQINDGEIIVTGRTEGEPPALQTVPEKTAQPAAGSGASSITRQR